MKNKGIVAGFELGGTKAVALIARGSEIVEMRKVPTADPQSTLESLADTLTEWQALYGQPAGIGIASFGPLCLDPRRPEYGNITTTPKPGWADTDLVDFFARRFGIPVSLDTDVNGAALAEYLWGAAQECGVVAYLTIGTGVGGGLVVDGQPVHGTVHSEIGHMRVRRVAGDPFAGNCPFHGDCIEGLISGPALAARTGKLGAEISNGDPIWTNAIADLAEGLATLLLTVAPQRILIGGGVFQSRLPLFPLLRHRVAEILNAYPKEFSAAELANIIRPPGLGDRAGPLGAVALVYAPHSTRQKES